MSAGWSGGCKTAAANGKIIRRPGHAAATKSWFGRRGALVGRNPGFTAFSARRPRWKRSAPGYSVSSAKTLTARPTGRAITVADRLGREPRAVQQMGPPADSLGQDGRRRWKRGGKRSFPCWSKNWRRKRRRWFGMTARAAHLAHLEHRRAGVARAGGRGTGWRCGSRRSARSCPADCAQCSLVPVCRDFRPPRAWRCSGGGWG